MIESRTPLIVSYTMRVEPDLHALREVPHVIRGVAMHDLLEGVRVVHVRPEPDTRARRLILVDAAIAAHPQHIADVQLLEPCEPPPGPERTRLPIDDNPLPGRISSQTARTVETQHLKGVVVNARRVAPSIV